MYHMLLPKTFRPSCTKHVQKGLQKRDLGRMSKSSCFSSGTWCTFLKFGGYKRRCIVCCFLRLADLLAQNLKMSHLFSSIYIAILDKFGMLQTRYLQLWTMHWKSLQMISLRSDSGRLCFVTISNIWRYYTAIAWLVESRCPVLKNCCS